MDVLIHYSVGFESRWYYYADKHGMAIFQDMPQKYLRQGLSNATVQHYVSDMKALIKGRGSHPCILQWTAFNEGDCWPVFVSSTTMMMLRSAVSTACSCEYHRWNNVTLPNIILMSCRRTVWRVCVCAGAPTDRGQSTLSRRCGEAVQAARPAPAGGHGQRRPERLEHHGRGHHAGSVAGIQRER